MRILTACNKLGTAKKIKICKQTFKKYVNDTIGMTKGGYSGLKPETSNMPN